MKMSTGTRKKSSTPSIAPLNRSSSRAFPRFKWALQNSGPSLQSFEEREEFSHHICSEVCKKLLTRLHEAVKERDAESVELLLEDGLNPNAQDCMGRTPLHFAVKGECNCDACIASATNIVSLLIKYPRSDINLQDSDGNTPLHLAAENQSTKAASILLYNGADVSIKSKSGVKAVKIMIEKIPDAMDSLLNRAVSIQKYDTSNVKCEIKLDFGPIVGFEAKGVSRSSSTKIQGNDGKTFRRETQLLTLILDSASSSARKKILTHPLIAIFLYWKWRCVRPLFWAMILFHAALLLLYTLYILDVYVISCPYRPKITEPAAVKAAKAAGITEGFLTRENETIRAEYIKFSWFQFSPQLNLKEIQLGITECHLEIGLTVKSILLLSLTTLMCFNEIFKMLPAPRVYWKASNNQFQWTYFLFIYLTAWPVFMDKQNISFWQYQAAAFGLFLAWSIMLFQLAKFPKLGLYVEILTQVLKNFGFFMLTYSCIVIAFALAFCVLFPGNAPFSSVPLSILKVLMMMVGEMEYETLFYGEEESPVDDLLYPITGHVLYGAFVIMITIVLMNLLVGLTVSDIQGLQKDAEVTRLSRQISEISQLESFIFSKRIQSVLPSRFAQLLRETILVVPYPSRKHYKTTNDSDKTSPLVENCLFVIRPNDPNDKSVTENLKIAVLRVAELSHRINRTNQCKMSNVQHKRKESMVKWGVGFKTPSPVGPPPSFPKTILKEKCVETSGFKNTPRLHLSIPIDDKFERTDKLFIERQVSFESNHSNENLSGGGGESSKESTFGRQYEYLIKRLEDNIMDRIKVQMDAQYKRIEEKLSESK